MFDVWPPGQRDNELVLWQLFCLWYSPTETPANGNSNRGCAICASVLGDRGLDSVFIEFKIHGIAAHN